MSLVLSLFPGIGLMDMAFESEGFCVVRGPDVLWGGDIHRFSPPAGAFDGVIGGPPCQLFTRFRALNPHCGERFGNLIPEFERVVAEAAPRWFLMENVEAAPIPRIGGYQVWDRVLNNRWFGAEQRRERRFSLGLNVLTPGDLAFADPWRHLEVALFEAPLGSFQPQPVVGDPRRVQVKIGGSGKIKATYAVTARHAARMPWVPGSVAAGHNPDKGVYGLEDACELQGLPRDFLADAPFTKQGKLKAIANGVPLPLGRAVARVINRVMEEG